MTVLIGGAGTDVVTIGNTGSTMVVSGVETLMGGDGVDQITLADATAINLQVGVGDIITDAATNHTTGTVNTIDLRDGKVGETTLAINGDGLAYGEHRTFGNDHYTSMLTVGVDETNWENVLADPGDILTLRGAGRTSVEKVSFIYAGEGQGWNGIKG